MKIPGLRTLNFLINIRWRYIPLHLAHFLMEIFPNDDIFSVIRASVMRVFGLKIGKRSRIGRGVVIYNYRNLKAGRDVTIGDGVYLNNFARIFIGNGCQVAFRSILATGSHPLQVKTGQPRSSTRRDCRQVRLGDSVWLGAGTVVLPGVRIGDCSVIGAGSVVTRSVGANQVVCGVPARTHEERHSQEEGAQTDPISDIRVSLMLSGGLSSGNDSDARVQTRVAAAHRIPRKVSGTN